MMLEGLSQETISQDARGETLDPEIGPAAAWDRDVAKHALDELFSLASKYRASKEYWELLRFVARFRFYSPFNAMLVHAQMAGASFVAPPHRWLRDYGRRIRPDAKPLVILRPMGPVMFVFDVSDTEATEEAGRVPVAVEDPFRVGGGNAGSRLWQVIENAKRDGIRIRESRSGSQAAGSLEKAAEELAERLMFHAGLDGGRKPIVVPVPVRYDLLVSDKQDSEAQYATIAHELAHLYCGHLGTPNERWWPDRRGLAWCVQEFEAESVAFLVCMRAGVDSRSETYLGRFLDGRDRVPPISIECVMKAAGLIETMSQQGVKPRKTAGEGS